MIDLDGIIKEIEGGASWNDVLLAAQDALVSMGTFEEPLDVGLIGMTYNEWQRERAKRAALAVLRAARHEDRR